MRGKSETNIRLRMSRLHFTLIELLVSATC